MCGSAIPMGCILLYSSFSLWSSFSQLRGFIHKGRIPDVANSHTSAQHWFGDGIHLLFQVKKISSLPWTACPGWCRCVEPEPGQGLSWLMARAVPGSCLTSTSQSLFRAASIPVSLTRAATSTSSQLFSYLSLNKLWKWLSSPLNYFFWHKIHASGSTG